MDKFPFFSLFAKLLGFSFGFGPTSACRSPSGIFFSPRLEGVKGVADYGALVHSGWGVGGVRNAGRACGSRRRCDVATA